MNKTWRNTLLVLGIVLLGAAARAAERIAIDGSSGVMPLAAALAQAFQQRHPQVQVELGKGLDPKARLEALAEGRIDIALASHGLDAAALGARGLAVHEVARTAVVFGVNAGVAVTDLSERQICALYAGQTTDWSSFGAPALAATVFTRPDSEVDAEVVREHVGCLKALRWPESVKVMQRSGDMARALASTEGAIGMTTMTVVEQSQGRVRALAIDGVAPSADNVERRRYGLVRKAFLVTRAQPNEAVSRFVAFLGGPEAQALIRANGAIPVAPSH